jgi:hypothetical protein
MTGAVGGSFDRDREDLLSLDRAASELGREGVGSGRGTDG